MRPGQPHPGGEQPPPWQNPYQQPGYQQPNPYQQPTGQWQQPEPVTGAMPAGGGGKGKTAIAIVTATAVLAAAVIIGIFVLGGDGDSDNVSRGGDTAGPARTPPEEDTDQDTGGSATGGAGGNPDDPRQGILQKPDPVIAPDWQVQTIENRHNAFDVPPDDWTVSSESMFVGIEDTRKGATEGEPLVSMAGVSIYKKDYCPQSEGLSWRAVAGTKGAQGATSTKEAARNEAVNWALGSYDQRQRGNLEVSDPEPFESQYGISGHTVTARVTNAPKDPAEPCTPTSGTAVTVSYLDLNNDMATWVLVADRGVADELPDETIEQIMSSLRPYPAPEAD